ncbi:YhcN/YlaJ family sporulation lipoprotein [Tepidibacter hydrothermalis]|uniref:YhcN/YlaJ family sporulation lipoprotein n=1 Tax=Tepidibacter hydrothermalis TaxID=3036126 RepID=A0ABY8EEB0_9FIRM|nr:YhcN/YlaJ family sporulation lipoprotein [Tepidibacter hydrothermalis]WFD09165.1 YhcN/YlaJ family sporulation lipoprotein [Tepidibacter hydrothermalis]
MNRRYVFYMIMVLVFMISGCNSASNNASMINAVDIEQDISKIQYIQNCNVLCTNTTALININFKNKNDMNYISQQSLKKNIKDIVKHENSNIKNIFITSDENISKKIQNISKNADGGKTVDLKWEIQNIVNNFIPNV